MCGAGKSSTANAILSQDVFEESGTRASEIQRGRVEDRNISIIDTPGFFNTQLTDEELQEQMMKSLSLTHPGPHIFLLVIKLETFEEDERNVVEQIQENFGEEAFKYTLVLFTGREHMSNRKWMVFKLNRKFHELVSHFRGQYHEINSKDEINQSHIKKLLKKIDEFIKQNDGQHYNIKSYAVSVMESRKEKKKQEENKYNEKEQEQITWKTLETNSAMEERTTQALSQPENECLIPHVQQTKKRTHVHEQMVKQRMICMSKEEAVGQRSITAVDTPGLFNPAVSEEDLMNEIRNCTLMSAPGPHVILLVIRLDMEITEEERNIVMWIQNNFGEDAVNYSFILFTHADHLNGESVEDHIRQSPDLQLLINQCDGRYHSFNNINRQNTDQVTELIEKMERMLQNNRGHYYSTEHFKMPQKVAEGFSFRAGIRIVPEQFSSLLNLTVASLREPSCFWKLMEEYRSPSEGFVGN
ncbi:GTPase IMAP family member 8 [Labeo rohita]|uniref:GTPase IMAP family member 8 n=1 Tax=Labeo rohita TaxID=84645 RepID=A0ABQ8L580_LABRO|nr:GTPase IMAP family member 8 [Labeo rohita]